MVATKSIRQKLFGGMLVAIAVTTKNLFGIYCIVNTFFSHEISMIMQNYLRTNMDAEPRQSRAIQAKCGTPEEHTCQEQAFYGARSRDAFTLFTNQSIQAASNSMNEPSRLQSVSKGTNGGPEICHILTTPEGIEKHRK